MVYWETAGENPSLPEPEREFTGIWQDTPKIVFSKTLEKVEGNARLATDGVAEEVARLKEQPGKDLAVGGAGLASACTRLGLVDEYRALGLRATCATGSATSSMGGNVVPTNGPSTATHCTLDPV